jgi:hypothetical protein
MAFIPEDGTGVVDANSLASVEFADSYHADRGNAAWAALDLDRKQQNLVKATDYVVAIFAAVWNGALIATDQAMPFPRMVNYVNIGLPLGIQQAVAELALIADTTPLLPTISRGKKRVKIGPLEVEYDGNAATQQQFIAATFRIASFLRQVSGAMAKLVRS